MSDTDLRALERRARATGHVDDRAALLRARVRSGELAQELLELAAYCGNEAARLVLGRCSCGCGWEHGAETEIGAMGSAFDHADSRDVLTFARGLSRRWRAVTVVRAAIALGHAVLDATSDHEGCESVHQRLEGTVDFDCSHLDEVTRKAEHWLAAPHSDRLDGCIGGGQEVGLAHYVAELLWDVQCHGGVEGGEVHLGLLLAYAMEYADHWLRGSGADARTVVRESLVAYALGERQGAPT